MGDGNEMPDGVGEFLRLFKEAQVKMRAVECFANIMEYVTGDGFDDANPESLDGLIEILMKYRETEIMHHMSGN